jgi:hypothetical protein
MTMGCTLVESHWKGNIGAVHAHWREGGERGEASETHVGASQ